MFKDVLNNKVNKSKIWTSISYAIFYTIKSISIFSNRVCCLIIWIKFELVELIGSKKRNVDMVKLNHFNMMS